MNVLAEGHSFLGLGMFEVSDDNQLLAYATDTTGIPPVHAGSERSAHRELLPFRMERVTSVAWSADHKTLFYVVEDEVTKRSHQLWRHILGAEGADALIYEEKDERFRIDIERTRSGAYLLLVSNSHTTSEIRYLRADQPFGEFQLESRNAKMTTNTTSTTIREARRIRQAASFSSARTATEGPTA